MSGEQPSIAPDYHRDKEIPLDLSLHRGGDMYGRPSDNCDYPTVIRRSNSMPSGYQPCQRSLEQRTRYYTEPDESPGFVAGQPEAGDKRVQFSSSPTSSEGAEYCDRSGMPVYDSSILPKKRKNLWRPYDSRVLAGDMETDSSSDSSASSDHDLHAVIPPPRDPVKKRKLDMLKYARMHEEIQDPRRVDNVYAPAHSETSTVYTEMGDTSGLSSSVPTTEDNWEYAPGVDQLAMINYPESHEKIIAGMKKRDIFGWSLKLNKPSTVNADPGESEPSKDSESVCLDGEKTYFELQTVKNNPTKLETPPKTISRVRSSPANLDTQPKSLAAVENTQTVTIEKCGTPPTEFADHSTSSQDTNKDICNSDNQAVNPVNVLTSSSSDNRDVQNEINNKIFIHGKDNVVKMFDESDNTTHRTDAQKGISLIDLIEEIEANAIAKDQKEQENQENRKNINNGVAALLKQCDHVKLQALDFLMSNVLLQEKGRAYTPKNACVQKMLRGDKIGSVSMLDVVEMQVEIGLR